MAWFVERNGDEDSPFLSLSEASGSGARANGQERAEIPRHRNNRVPYRADGGGLEGDLALLSSESPGSPTSLSCRDKWVGGKSAGLQFHQPPSQHGNEALSAHRGMLALSATQISRLGAGGEVRGVCGGMEGAAGAKPDRFLGSCGIDSSTNLLLDGSTETGWYPHAEPETISSWLSTCDHRQPGKEAPAGARSRRSVHVAPDHAAKPGA